MPVQRLGDISAAQRTVLEERTLRRAVPFFHFGKFAMRREFVDHEGRAVTFNRWSTLSAATTAIGEGEVPVGESLTANTVTVTPDIYGSFYELSKSLVRKGIFEVKATDAPELLGEQAGLTADTLIRNGINAGGTNQFAGGQASEGAVTAVDIMGFDEIMAARTTLRGNNARPIPDLGFRYALIIHPDNEYDLLLDATFQSVYIHGGLRGDENPMYGRALTDILDIRIFVSSNVTVTADGGSGTVDTYDCYLVGYESYGIAGLGDLLPRAVEGGTGTVPNPITLMFNDWEMYVPLQNKCSIAWMADQGQVVLNSSWIIQIFCASSVGSN